jgi:alpha-galactosidase
MAVEAALTGDKDLAKLALLHDPLTGAICTPDEVWKMADEMFGALAPWLPQF